jgi:NCS1 family nucleobase:cation symporter-1
MNVLIEDVSASIVEDGVTPDRQTMGAEKVFWSHFSTNLTPATWVLGALLVVIGLDFKTGLLAIIIGNIIGCAPAGACATIGPRTGLTQIEISRFSFGRLGTRVPAFLNFFNAISWDAVGNVPSALALVALAALYGTGLPFWVALVLLVSVQLAASIYGHHVVQLVAKYLCYVLIVVFTVSGVVAIAHGGSLATVHDAIRPATFVLGVSMIAGAAMGFTPYCSDYSRYLPRATKPRTIFLLAFGGLFVASTLLELCGLLTANRLSDLSTAGVIAGIGTLTGAFAPIALFALAISAISSNSINDNTAAYSLISVGVRVPRPFAALLTTSIGFILALLGAAKFADLFSNYLVLLMYWIAPWVAIVLTDWWMFRGAPERVRRWSSGATIFLIVTPLTLVLFSSTIAYTGPIARLLGGTDIGFYVGFFTASLAYALVERPRAVRFVALTPAGEPAE